jgi:hypothetical protein
VTDDDATLTFHASVAGSTFECRLDGGAFVPCTSPVTYTGLALGGHVFEVRATAGGLTDPTPASRSWTVIASPDDTTPPDTSFTQTPASPSPLPAVFAFAANETPATFECRLKRSTLLPWTACTSPYTFTSLPPAPYTFQVRATDAAGNLETIPATFAWTVAAGGDQTPPETTITSGPSDGPSSTATFTFTSEPGATFRCRLRAGDVWSAWTVCSTPHVLTGLAPRGYRFQVRAMDAAGNEDPTPAGWSWKVTVAGSAAQR